MKQLKRLRSFMCKPNTPYQEVVALVLLHAFHPKLVYFCFDVENAVDLGSCLDDLPSDES